MTQAGEKTEQGRVIVRDPFGKLYQCELPGPLPLRFCHLQGQPIAGRALSHILSDSVGGMAKFKAIAKSFYKERPGLRQALYHFFQQDYDGNMIVSRPRDILYDIRDVGNP